MNVSRETTKKPAVSKIEHLRACADELENIQTQIQELERQKHRAQCNLLDAVLNCRMESCLTVNMSKLRRELQNTAHL